MGGCRFLVLSKSDHACQGERAQNQGGKQRQGHQNHTGMHFGLGFALRRFQNVRPAEGGDQGFIEKQNQHAVDAALDQVEGQEDRSSMAATASLG